MAFMQGDSFSADRIISEYKGIEKLEEQIKFVLTHLYSLDQKGVEKFRNQILEFEKIWSDLDFMREVKERDGLITDYTVEYHGKDYGDEDPFKYKAELEKKINKISLRIMATLGMIVKYLKEANLVIDEDT